MIYAVEVHEILKNIFDDVRGYKTENQLKICCPKCQEREGLAYPDGKFNLEINMEKNIFHCWKCDSPKYSGRLGKLIYEYGTKSDYTLYKSFSKIYYNNKTFHLNENVDLDDYVRDVKLPNEFISFKDLNFDIYSHVKYYNYWVLDRQLSYETAIKYGVGFCDKGDYANRIIIPSYDKYNELNFFTSRYIGNNKKTPKYLNCKEDKTKIIFNENKINWDSTIYLVEGVFDKFSMPNNTIPILGKVLYELLFNIIREKKPNIIICLDPDATSDAIGIYRQLLAVYGYNTDKIRIIINKTDLDVDEIRRMKGIESVAKLLRSAKILNVDEFI